VPPRPTPSSAPTRLLAPSPHARSFGPACQRPRLGRATTKGLVACVHCRPVPTGSFFCSALAAFLIPCAPRSAPRIAVGRPCVFDASRHLVFRPVGVLRYLLPGSGGLLGRPPAVEEVAPDGGRPCCFGYRVRQLCRSRVNHGRTCAGLLTPRTAGDTSAVHRVRGPCPYSRKPARMPWRRRRQIPPSNIEGDWHVRHAGAYRHKGSVTDRCRG
jgi:hypothetical protein